MHSKLKRNLMAGLSIAALGLGLAPFASALTVRDDVTVEGSEDRAADPQYDGVIQIYMLSPTGGVFFNCTGSMINPRTVISAAHCFNNRPSTAYGLEAGQFTPIIAYGPDTFDGLFNWLNTGSLTLDARNGITFGSQVIIHPDADSAFGAPLSFPGADVAMIALNDPLSQLPTYSMMFSQLPVGTHMQMVAYGGHGIGSTGDVGIDGKRQAGENILGLVGSQNDFLRGLDNTTDTYIPTPDADQLLYHIDFDNPVRNTDVCSRDNLFFGFPGLVCDDPTKPINGVFLNDGVFVATDDIDLFPGDALPNEAGTAGGDSGSALFADELIEGELIITGVLSGGWTFVAPAPSGYGDTSYYNPLFLFYDFIAEANPYKYVSAVAGDGNWSDGDHWVQDLDPGYLILDANGNVVNGLPEGPEPGVAGQDPREGIVFDVDINDLIPPVEEAPAGAATDANGLALSIVATNAAAGGLVAAGNVSDTQVAGDNLAANGLIAVRPSFGEVPGASVERPAPTGDPELITFLYGDIGSPGPWTGPGATGAVPNNGVNENGFLNYFEVTLGAAGTTTADVDVVIDKLKITNSGAALLVNEDVQFVSLVDTQIMGGTLDVNGVFGSRDILNMGLVTGGANGLIVTDTLFNMGMLDAGGGLGVEGDVVFTSGGAINWSGGTLDVDGDVSLAGVLTFSSSTPGQSGTLLTHTGERIGTFSTAGYNTGVRRLEFDYAANSVAFSYFALAFSDFVGGDLEPNQAAIAELLDELRVSNFQTLEGLYDSLDFLSGAELIPAFDALTPTAAFQAPALTTLTGSTLPGHLDRRYSALTQGNGSGMAFNTRGAGIQIASLNNQDIVGLIDQAETLETGGSAAGASGAPAGERRYGVFGELSFASGEAETGIGSGMSDVSGMTLTLGVDGQVSDALRLGVFGSYSDGESDFQTGLGATESEGYAFGAFGLLEAGFGNVTGYAGFGQRDLDLARSGLSGMLTASTEADEVLAGLGIHRYYQFDSQNGFAFMPEARVDYQSYDIGGYEETGGLGAMAIEGRELSSIMVKAGGDLHFYDVDSGADAPLRPSIGARFVYDLDGERDTATAALIASPSMSTMLAGASRDKAWGEIRGALHFGQADARWTGSVFAETTVDRGDLSYVTLGLNVRGRF